MGRYALLFLLVFGSAAGQRSLAGEVKAGVGTSVDVHVVLCPPSVFLQAVRTPRDWGEVSETTGSITRARMFEAMARAVAERGYAAVTVTDVVNGARVSRRTFYEHFEDKEHCFLETYRTGCESGIAQIDAALRALEDPDWRTRLSVSLETYLSILAAEPDVARVLLLDVNWTNNSKTISPRGGAAATKWSLMWLRWLEDHLLTWASLA